MFALHKHNYYIFYGRKTKDIPGVYLPKWGFCFSAAQQIALLRRDLERGISRPFCTPGLLDFPHHLLVFLPYIKGNPREKEKKNPTKQVLRGGFPTSIFRSKAYRNLFALLVLGNPTQGCVFVPAGRGLSQWGKTEMSGISTDTSWQYSLQVQSFVLKVLYKWHVISPHFRSVYYRIGMSVLIFHGGLDTGTKPLLWLWLHGRRSWQDPGHMLPRVKKGRHSGYSLLVSLILEISEKIRTWWQYRQSEGKVVP